MRHAAAILLLALLFVSSRALTQQQTPTGAIEGTVVRSDTGEPINGVQVALTRVNVILAAVPGAADPVQQPQGRGGLQSVTPATGADGKFSFKNLNAGAYLVAATVTGFVRTEYGQRNLNGQGRLIFLTAGQTFKDAALRMTPTGAVTGRIFDENGRLATGAPVQLVRVIYNVQGRNYQSPAQSAADDRGEYRFYGVTPGRYYLVAGNPPGPIRVPAGVGGAVSSQRYSLVFYPSASNLEQASMIEVKPGGEIPFDFRVQRQSPGYRVKGRIVDSTGLGMPANTQVMVGYRSFYSSGSFSNMRSFDPVTGNFELQNVPTGDYTLQVQLPDTNPIGVPTITNLTARQAAQASRPGALIPIQVVDKDLEGVVLTLTRGVSVNGRFIVEGQPVSVIPNLQRMTLAFGPANAFAQVELNPAGTPVAEDGTFQVVGLREGDYRVSLSGVVPPTSGLYLKSIRYAGDDVLTKPLKFSGSGSGGFEVTLGRGPGQLAGNVTDSRSQAVPGAAVFVIPIERGRMNDYKRVAADQNGHYSLAGVTPGDYQLFSWESIENGGHYDPDFLKQYEQQGKIVHVAESSNQNVDVRLIAAP